MVSTWFLSSTSTLYKRRINTFSTGDEVTDDLGESQVEHHRQGVVVEFSRSEGTVKHFLTFRRLVLPHGLVVFRE